MLDFFHLSPAGEVKGRVMVTPDLCATPCGNPRPPMHSSIPMMLAINLLRAAVFGAAVLLGAPLHAAAEFPFGLQMTLDAAPQPGSKRVPNLDIGDAGETLVELWCKGGKGQFSVAGSTVVFVAGTMDERDCPATRAQQDDELLANLSAATNWKRQGDAITFVGPKPLKFLLNTN